MKVLNEWKIEQCEMVGCVRIRSFGRNWFGGNEEVGGWAEGEGLPWVLCGMAIVHV